MERSIMTLEDLWKLKRSDDAVASGYEDNLIVGSVVTIDDCIACVSGCDIQGKRASRWCAGHELRYADDAEDEMYRAWKGLELYRDVFPEAKAWIDDNI